LSTELVDLGPQVVSCLILAGLFHAAGLPGDPPWNPSAQAPKDMNARPVFDTLWMAGGTAFVGAHCATAPRKFLSALDQT